MNNTLNIPNGKLNIKLFNLDSHIFKNVYTMVGSNIDIDYLIKTIFNKIGLEPSYILLTKGFTDEDKTRICNKYNYSFNITHENIDEFKSILLEEKKCIELEENIKKKKDIVIKPINEDISSQCHHISSIHLNTDLNKGYDYYPQSYGKNLTGFKEFKSIYDYNFHNEIEIEKKTNKYDKEVFEKKEKINQTYYLFFFEPLLFTVTLNVEDYLLLEKFPEYKFDFIKKLDKPIELINKYFNQIYINKQHYEHCLQFYESECNFIQTIKENKWDEINNEIINKKILDHINTHYDITLSTYDIICSTKLYTEIEEIFDEYIKNRIIFRNIIFKCLSSLNIKKNPNEGHYYGLKKKIYDENPNLENKIESFELEREDDLHYIHG